MTVPVAIGSLYDVLASVSTSLATLALQVRAETGAGLTSRSTLAEDVLLPVFRRVYDAPGLANANDVAPNVPGVDLFDPASGLGVQVSAEVSAAKVAHTIDAVIAGPLPVRRLVVAFVADAKPRTPPTTRQAWVAAVGGRFAFDPVQDVLAFKDLLGRIRGLPAQTVREIDDELRALVRGTRAVDLLVGLRAQAEAQLAEERRVARYIPDVFVETRDTKYHARCFTHPVLFLRRVLAWFARDPLAPLNRFAAMGGVPLLEAPLPPATAPQTPDAAARAAGAFATDVVRLEQALGTYHRLGEGPGASLPRDPARAYVFDQVKYQIEMIAGGYQYRVADRRTELTCVEARLFLLVGPAGQGKTNFLCDVVERFLLPHDIPCAYLTARQLSRAPEADLTAAVRRMLFPAAVATLDDALAGLGASCAQQGRPFVLVLDGLNEHPDVRRFAEQLEFLLEALVRHPHVRVLMTCRSEFLEQRFGGLLRGPLAPALHVSRGHGLQFDDGQHAALVDGYFTFFQVRRELVEERVVDVLRRGPLLLRFFCEAYGARGRGADYRQPRITSVYRDEIYRTYLTRKLAQADEALAADRSVSYNPVRPSGLRAVLTAVAEAMLAAGRFSDVPRAVVPPALDHALAALLDEDVVLRRDPGPVTSVLAEPDEVLSFTFDELRDFVLAQHLLDVDARDPARFDAYVAGLTPEAAQSLEGVQRFLFYAARVPDHRAFLGRYRAHPWYGAVYDTEVFRVVPAHLDDVDREVARAALAQGGDRARHFARELSICWHTGSHPVLNLELLLAYVAGADDQFLVDVVTPTFGPRRYDQRQSLGEEFCGFVEERILPSFTPADDADEGVLFRLLLLLAPVQSTPSLESPAVATFRALAAAHPAYAERLLRDALPARAAWNRAHVWRLLGDLAPALFDPAPVVTDAAAVLADPTTGPSTRREVERLLARVAPADGRP